MAFFTAPASGKKRPAADDFPNPLSKRLELLSLKPAPGTRRIAIPGTNRHSYSRPSSSRAYPSPNRPQEERMDVDSTSPNVVYIHDIDAELASDDEDPETKGKIIFVPDIEREMTRIPHAVLNAGGNDAENGCMAVVLYSVPKGLTVDEGADGVRKAILESRERIRQRQREEREEEERQQKGMQDLGLHKMQMVDMDGDIDMDAMDIE